jgi:hypothetical protein
MRRIVGIAVLLISGCTGLITEPGEDFGSPGSSGSSGVPPGAATAGIAPAARVVRLTHDQWENTVRDLFYLADAPGLSASFPTDPKTGGFIFDNNAGALSVDDTLWDGYRVAAASVVELVMANPGVLAKILPPEGGGDAARARTFIEQFGRRAYRRPLSAAEVDAHLAVFQSAPPLYSGTAAFEAGVALVLSAFLQSPYFVYRVELSKQAVGDQIPLDDWEIAARLSYTLFDSMPDELLFAAAAAGELSTAKGVEAAARRMLDDPRASQAVVRFHAAVLDVWKYATKDPDRNQFPEIPGALFDYAQKETELFVEHVFSQGGSYAELLTSNKSYVNAELAELYGLSGSHGSEFQQATLDPTQRSGIFTQIGFLAVNATSADPDPIHRGAFLVKRIACLSVAAPPDDIPPLPDANGKTNRETVEAHTEMPGTECAGCHSTYINPYGFPFENYDVFGRWRDQDNGQPIDATSAPLIDGENRPVANAVELLGTLAASQSVHDCYAKHWVEFGFGRAKAPEDSALLETLGKLSRQGGSVKDLIATLVTNRAFVNRSVKELP